jgi:glutathione S-transferase
MVLKLFGHPFSTCTKRVLTVLEETGTPYEIVRVDVLGGEHKGDAFLARQPFGQIPVLVCATSLFARVCVAR